MNDSAKELIVIVKNLGTAFEKRQDNDVGSPQTIAAAKIASLNKRKELIKNDTDCYLPGTIELVCRDIDIKKRKLVLSLYGSGDDVVSPQVLPFHYESAPDAGCIDESSRRSPPPMNQSSMMGDFNPSSDDDVE